MRWLPLALAFVVGVGALQAVTAVGDREPTRVSAAEAREDGLDLFLLEQRRRFEAVLDGFAESAFGEELVRQVQREVRLEGIPIAEASGSRDFPRTSFALARHCLDSVGGLQPELLVRHTRLNPEDRPVGPVQLQELRALVEQLAARFSPLEEIIRETRIREMIDQIEAGLVNPVEVPEPTEEQYLMLAYEFVTNRADYESIDAVVTALKRGPTPTVFLGEGHIVHRGEAYLHRQFRALPHSDAMRSAARHFALEVLGAVGGWFVQRGFSTWDHLALDVDAAHVLDGARGFDPRSVAANNCWTIAGVTATPHAPVCRDTDGPTVDVFWRLSMDGLCSQGEVVQHCLNNAVVTVRARSGLYLRSERVRCSDEGISETPAEPVARCGRQRTWPFRVHSGSRCAPSSLVCGFLVFIGCNGC